MDQERIHFGSVLKSGREARHLSLSDVARVTKIPERSLERLEGGRFDELPAEVFVRGFVRSFARAIGLDADDMVRRYGEIVQSGSPVIEVSLAGAVRAAAARAVTVSNAQAATARAATATPRATTVGPRAATATATPRAVTAAPRAATLAPRAATAALPAPATIADGSLDGEGDVEIAAPTAAVAPVEALAPAPAPFTDEASVDSEIVAVRKPARPKDPSHTDEMRTLSKAILDAGRETRRLPLTLAVIILVIVATLTMSLLLNRPSHLGDGITSRSVPTDARVRV